MTSKCTVKRAAEKDAQEIKTLRAQREREVDRMIYLGQCIDTATAYISQGYECTTRVLEDRKKKTKAIQRQYHEMARSGDPEYAAWYRIVARMAEHSLARYDNALDTEGQQLQDVRQQLDRWRDAARLTQQTLDQINEQIAAIFVRSEERVESNQHSHERPAQGKPRFERHMARKKELVFLAKEIGEREDVLYDVTVQNDRDGSKHFFYKLKRELVELPTGSDHGHLALDGRGQTVFHRPPGAPRGPQNNITPIQPLFVGR